jgi:DNA-binding GntR family transcriptional regulator
VALQGKRITARYGEGRGMAQILSDKTIEKVEKLVSELRAITHRDTEYWRNRCPKWHETVAFVSGQKRRSEIIRQLLRVSR